MPHLDLIRIFLLYKTENQEQWQFGCILYWTSHESVFKVINFDVLLNFNKYHCFATVDYFQTFLISNNVVSQGKLTYIIPPYYLQSHSDKQSLYHQFTYDTGDCHGM